MTILLDEFKHDMTPCVEVTIHHAAQQDVHDNADSQSKRIKGMETWMSVITINHHSLYMPRH